MFSRICKLSVACAFALILGGCSQNLARFSVASTGNVALASDSKKGEYVEGEDCIHHIFGISFGNTQNRISGAVAKALEKATKRGEFADALINVDIRARYWSVFFYGQNCIVARGQAVGVK